MATLSVLGVHAPRQEQRESYARLADRLARLQALTTALARARTYTDIGDTIIGEAMPALGACVGVVAILSEDGKLLRNVGFKGVSQATEEAWLEYSVDAPVPVAEAARTGRPVIVTTLEERNRRYPVLAQVHGIEEGGGVTTLPLLLDGRVQGALGFCFSTSREFDASELSFLTTLADQCALAVERIRLTEVAQREIDERKRSEAMLRETQERLTLALSAAKMVAWEFDIREGRVVCSGTGSELFGFAQGTREEFQRTITPDDLPAIERAYQDTVERGLPYMSEYRVVAADGQIRWIHSRGSASRRDPDGTPRRLIGVLVDISDRKSAESALEEAGRRKDQFLAMLAHELRNPLAPIRHSAEVLLRLDSADPRLARLSAVIDRQSTHMTRIVDDLLDVSRITQGRLLVRKTALDLVDLVRGTTNDHRPAIESAGLLLEVQAPSRPLWVMADGTRLSQAIANLLHNSQKFTDPQGRISVTVAADAQEREATIVVRDTGIGMTPEMQAYVFEPFAQADSTLDRSRGGLGLGLALVKGIIELHGGSVSVESAGPGSGACFMLRIPLVSAREAYAARYAPSTAVVRRVLVIEDNADTADTLALALELAGHEVQIARTGSEGVSKAANWLPDIVLSDIGLPGEMDGYAVARTLRASRGAGLTPRLVALSGYGQDEDKAKARAAGFDAHLTKPVELAALERLVASFDNS